MFRPTYFFISNSFPLRIASRSSKRPSCRAPPQNRNVKTTCKQLPQQVYGKELEQARREARPYRIDKSQLTPLEIEELRLRSKAIPLVVDKEPLDVVFEDDNFLVVNKPPFLKMHPSHRFEGGSLLNRAIGHCGFTPFLVHRLDMVSSVRNNFETELQS